MSFQSEVQASINKIKARIETASDRGTIQALQMRIDIAEKHLNCVVCKDMHAKRIQGVINEQAQKV